MVRVLSPHLISIHSQYPPPSRKGISSPFNNAFVTASGVITSVCTSRKPPVSLLYVKINTLSGCYFMLTGEDSLLNL